MAETAGAGTEPEVQGIPPGMTLTPIAIDAATNMLIKARRKRRPLSELAPHIKPRTLDDGYAIQAHVAGKLSFGTAGWKVGCTSREARDMLGIDGNFAGCVFEPLVVASGVTLDPADYIAPGVEGEFGLRLGADIDPADAPFDAEKLTAAIDAVVPVIEIVDSRLANWKTQGAPSIIADNGVNGGLVVGTAVTDWRDIDLETMGITMRIDGTITGEGTGADVLDRPIGVAVWLANLQARRGIRMAAGSIISTGTCTSVTALTPGSQAIADYGPLGTVSVSLAAASG